MDRRRLGDGVGELKVHRSRLFPPPGRSGWSGDFL